MKFDDVKSLLLLTAVGVGAWIAWSAYRKGSALVSDTLGGIGAAAGAAWDSVTGAASAAVDTVLTQTPAGIVYANITRPAVPQGGQSLQQTHVTDLPEGSYQAPAMFWSLHPNAVFYD